MFVDFKERVILKSNLQLLKFSNKPLFLLRVSFIFDKHNTAKLLINFEDRGLQEDMKFQRQLCI